jgi:exodeoxyribonuclease X
VLRYWLGLDLDPALAMPPHRASPDAYTTAHIFARMLAEEGENRLKRLVAWSKEPGLLPKLLFGKHRGMRFSEVPADYLEWITKQTDMDEDVRFTAWKELARREFGG